MTVVMGGEVVVCGGKTGLGLRYLRYRMSTTAEWGLVAADGREGGGEGSRRERDVSWLLGK